MDPPRWERVKAVYHSALDRNPAERVLFLEETCGGDRELREEVESLLAEATGGSFLEHPAWQTEPTTVLLTGRTLAHYQVAEKLGAGGMGVVYKARDTHLDRLVALKVLPPERVAEPQRKRRFIQEAKAASGLNHPNIVTIHDIGSDSGVDFIAMEYVTGKTLDRQIGRKGLSLSEALKYAIQISDALARAHGAGIVHRDLKPSNVMVDEHGLVKVLDFGLAKLTEVQPVNENAATTDEGTVVGTAAYMSPEQTEGKKVDARSDIFSFGAVLYEMVTGRRAFAGDSQASTWSSVLHEEPKPLEGVPHDLEKIITRCLRKDPQRRFQHMDDVKVALEELKEESDSGKISGPTISTRGRRRSLGLLVATVGVLLVTAIGVIWWLVHPPKHATGMVLRMLTSDSGLTTNPALSPDGKLLAYASDRGGEGNLDIWVRQMPRGEPVRLTRDKADESEPDFSPDGSQIVFRSERDGGAIYVMPALGGEPRLVAREGRSPRFSPGGNLIVYWTGPTYDTTFPRSYKMFVVAVTGGTPRQLRAEFDLARFPTWSPDGRHILFYGSLQRFGSGNEDFDWWVTPLDGGAAVRTEAFAALRRQSLTDVKMPRVWQAEESQIVFAAQLGSSRNLWRVPIQPTSFKVKGVPERLTFGTGTETQPTLAATAPGRNLVFVNENSNADLWSLPLDANHGKPTGRIERLTQDAAPDQMPDISADGRKVAFVSSRSGNQGVWIKDLATGQETALVVTAAQALNPVFSPDGSKIAYTVGSNATRMDAYTIPLTGGVAERACDDCGSTYDWSRDGKWIVIRSRDQPRRVRLLSPTSGQITDYLKHPGYSFYWPRLSPDNRWLAAYARKGASQWHLIIVPFRVNAPPAEKDWLAVAEGIGVTMACRWSPDGKVLYYTSERDGSPCIWAQRLDPGTKRAVGDPCPIFHAHAARHSVAPGRQSLAIPRDATAGRLVFVISETNGNIWMAERN